jgi:hypothetical protein
MLVVRGVSEKTTLGLVTGRGGGSNLVGLRERQRGGSGSSSANSFESIRLQQEIHSQLSVGYRHVTWNPCKLCTATGGGTREEQQQRQQQQKEEQRGGGRKRTVRGDRDCGGNEGGIFVTGAELDRRHRYSLPYCTLLSTAPAILATPSDLTEPVAVQARGGGKGEGGHVKPGQETEGEKNLHRMLGEVADEASGESPVRDDEAVRGARGEDEGGGKGAIAEASMRARGGAEAMAQAMRSKCGSVMKMQTGRVAGDKRGKQPRSLTVAANVSHIASVLEVGARW